jgi:hypothetical protein
MDVLTHSLIAVACIAGAYYAGRWSTRNDLTDVIEALLSNLEKEGYIWTKTDENGEKELILISDIIAKSVNETNKVS